jgi:hypothetical protein
MFDLFDICDWRKYVESIQENKFTGCISASNGEGV